MSDRNVNHDTTSTFHRTARNLLVCGHRNACLPDNESTRENIFAALEKVIKAFDSVVEGKDESLRILTGLADGTDAKAAEIARANGFPLHVLAPCQTRDLDVAEIQASRVALIAQDVFDTAPDTMVAAADEAKLSLADALIVVWDGNPPQGYSGGAVHVMIEAIRRYTPVVWIDARTDLAGTIRGLDPSRLDAATLAMLAADDSYLVRLQDLFSVFEPHLESDIKRLVDAFWNAELLAPLCEALSHEDIEPGDRPTHKGCWHTWFLSGFGPWKRKRKEAVRAWRGPEEYVLASQLQEMTWQWFDRLDRAATHSANKHRDDVVLIHGFSVLAVWAAVAGAIAWLSIRDFAWGFIELVALSCIGLFVGLNHRQGKQILTNHDAWLHFRQAAEALRMGAMLHPLMAALPALHRDVWTRASDKQEPILAKPYNWLVIQLLREVGVPLQNGSMGLEPRMSQLVAGLQALIKGQINYHRGAHDRYYKTHHRLHLLTLCVFGIVVSTVLVHLSVLTTIALEHLGTHLPEWMTVFAHWTHKQHWLLILTAVFPALAAGLHGVTSKIELHRLAKSSSRMTERLEVLGRAADSLKPSDRPMTLRALALETTVTMYAEHDAWAELMADQGLEIPA